MKKQNLAMKKMSYRVVWTIKTSKFIGEEKKKRKKRQREWKNKSVGVTKRLK